MGFCFLMGKEQNKPLFMRNTNALAYQRQHGVDQPCLQVCTDMIAEKSYLIFIFLQFGD